MKKTRLIVAALAFCMAALCAFAFAACGNEERTPVTEPGSDKEPEHVHTYATELSSDGEGHWYASSCGHEENKLAYAEHAWGAGVVTKEASETEEGIITYACVVCGKEKTENIDLAGHSYSTDWTADANNHWHAATCSHESETAGEAAHDFGDWSTLFDSTHLSKGAKSRTCSVCNYTETAAIDETQDEYEPDGHTYDKTKFVSDATGHWFASTCGHAVKDGFAAHNFNSYITANGSVTVANGKYDFSGYHIAKCRNCNYEKRATHDNSGGVTVVQERTCEQDGITQTKCSCGFVKTTTTKGGHTYASAWSKDETYHWNDATCEHTELQNNKAEHKFGEPTVGTTDGKKYATYQCSTCKYSKKEEVLTITSFGLEAWYHGNNDSKTGAGVAVQDGGTLNILNDGETVWLYFTDLLPAGSLLDNEKDDVKLYSVAEDGTKTELTFSTTPMGFVSGYVETGRVGLRIKDGNTYKVRVETQNAYKEFTVVPTAMAAPTVQYSLDEGATWQDYSTSNYPSVAVGSSVWFRSQGSEVGIVVESTAAEYFTVEERTDPEGYKIAIVTATAVKTTYPVSFYNYTKRTRVRAAAVAAE